MPSRIGVAARGARRHDERRRPPRPCGTVALDPGENAAVVARRGRGSRHAHSVWRAVGLGMRKRHRARPVRDRREKMLLLRVAAAARDELRAERDGREPRLDDQRTADRFHQAHRIHRAAAETAVRGRQRKAEQAHLRHRAPDVGDSRLPATRRCARRVSNV